MSPRQITRLTIGMALIAAVPLAGCHHDAAPPVPTAAEQQQELDKENAHLTPDQQAAAKAQAAAQANIKPQ